MRAMTEVEEVIKDRMPLLQSEEETPTSATQTLVLAVVQQACAWEQIANTMHASKYIWCLIIDYFLYHVSRALVV